MEDYALQGERGHVLGVGTVAEHHGGPVLARVHRLGGAIYLGGLGGLVLMLDTGDENTASAAAPATQSAAATTVRTLARSTM